MKYYRVFENWGFSYSIITSIFTNLHFSVCKILPSSPFHYWVLLTDPVGSSFILFNILWFIAMIIHFKFVMRYNIHTVKICEYYYIGCYFFKTSTHLCVTTQIKIQKNICTSGTSVFSVPSHILWSQMWLLAP